jgi:hypothetical protein
MRCHSDHFRPHTIHIDLFRCLLPYIWLIATLMDYLCLPHTIVYLFDVFTTFSDLLLTLFIFAVIDIPMFWLFIVMVDCAITIGSDSDPYGLLVISDPSDAISTSLRSFLLIFYLPLPLHTENNIVLRSLALRKTLYRFDLTHTAFYCVPRPYTVYIDLDTLRSTSFFRLYFVSVRVLSVSLRSSSTFWYLHRTAFTDIPHPLHSHIRSLLIRIFTYFTTFVRSGHSQEQIIPELRTP